MNNIASVWSKRIANFRNPVLQAVGGSGYNPGTQRWPFSRRTVTGIAIAAQSPIDSCDIILSSDLGGVGRLRVSADRPWFGRLEPGEGEETLTFVPCRPVDGFSAFTTSAGADEVHGLQLPDLIVDIYTDAPPPPVARGRAVNLDWWSNAGGVASVSPVAVLNVCGRHEKIGFRWQANTFAGGCTAVTGTLTLTTYGLDAAGAFTTIATTRASAGLASGVTGELWVAPEAPSVTTAHDGSCQWCYASLSLAPDAGTFGYRIVGEAR